MSAVPWETLFEPQAEQVWETLQWVMIVNIIKLIFQSSLVCWYVYIVCSVG